MVSFDSTQLAGWLSMYFWPMLRILALISTAPITSEKQVPKKVKIGLAAMITFLIAPALPVVDTPIFSTPALWLTMQQIMIGTALGLTMQLAFAAIRMAGEIMGLQMGISFATFYDPSNRLNSPLLAQFLNLLAVLLFLSFNGHLWLISLLADSFHTLPINPNPMNAEGFMAVAQAGSIVFSGGLMLALPIVTLLLTLNMALGILNRVKKPDWRVSIASPTARVRSMNGVVLEAQAGNAPVLMPENMPPEVVVVDEAVDLLPLSAGPEAWAARMAEILLRSRAEDGLWLAAIEASRFSMRRCVTELDGIYAEEMALRA